LNLDPAEIAPEPLAAAGRIARRFRLGLFALVLLAVWVMAHGLARARPGLRGAGTTARAAVAVGLLVAAVLITGSFARPTGCRRAPGARLLDAPPAPPRD